MKEGTLGVEEMQEFIRQTAIQFPTEKLKVKEKTLFFPHYYPEVLRNQTNFTSYCFDKYLIYMAVREQKHKKLIYAKLLVKRAIIFKGDSDYLTMFQGINFIIPLWIFRALK